MKRFLGVFLNVIFVFILCSTSLSEAQQKGQFKHSAGLTRKAATLFQEKKYDQAKTNLKEAIRLNNKNVKAHEMISLIYYLERDFRAATVHANRAIKLNSKTAGAYYVLGMISYQQGKTEDARRNLDQSVKFAKNPERRKNALDVLEMIKKDIKSGKRPNIRKKINEIRNNREAGEENAYKPYVAVFNFEDTNVRAEKAGLGQTLTEMLSTALIQKGRYTVMERVQLEKVLQEQSLNQSGVIDTDTALKVGKLAGLEVLILGSISRLKTSFEADARLIEIETGKALAAANANVKSVDNFRDMANELADQLSSKAELVPKKMKEGELESSEIEN